MNKTPQTRPIWVKRIISLLRILITGPIYVAGLFIMSVLTWLSIVGILWVCYLISPLTFSVKVENPKTLVCIENRSNFEVVALESIFIGKTPLLINYSSAEKWVDFSLIKRGDVHCGEISEPFTKPLSLKYHFINGTENLTRVLPSPKDPNYDFAIRLYISDEEVIDATDYDYYYGEYGASYKSDPYYRIVLYGGTASQLFWLPEAILLTLMIIFTFLFLLKRRKRGKTNGTIN
ncbi:MAG: hypothetical protein AB7U41_06040 [Dongiaceae bacterium]